MCKLSTPSSSLSSRKGSVKGGTSLTRLTKKCLGITDTTEKTAIPPTEIKVFYSARRKIKVRMASRHRRTEVE